MSTQRTKLKKMKFLKLHYLKNQKFIPVLQNLERFGERPPEGTFQSPSSKDFQSMIHGG